MVSENKRKSLDAYNATCDYISLRPKKERGQEIRSAAKASGQSLQGYILEAVQERMDREKNQQKTEKTLDFHYEK